MGTPGSARGSRDTPDPPTNQTILDRMSAMFGGMDARFNGISERFGEVEKSLGNRIDRFEKGMDTKVGEIRGEVAAVAAEVEGVVDQVGDLRKRLDRNDLELEAKIDQAIDKRVKGDRSRLPPDQRGRVRDMSLLQGPSRVDGDL